jgi:hypothetical protein
MKRFNLNNRFFWGALLLGLGLLLLLQNLNILNFVWSALWTILFAAGGVFFLFMFAADRHGNWWAIIPGLALLGLASTIGIESIFPRLGNAVGGALFLAQLGASFWVIYLLDRSRWWAIIPGGVLLTLAVVASLDHVLPGFETGSVFFLGLAATFGLVYLKPGTPGRMGWALIPAAVLLAIAIVTGLAAAGPLFKYIWPAILIAIGAWMVYQTVRPR